MRTIPVFVNGHCVTVPDDATVMDAVCAWSETAGRELAEGRTTATDSRGLPLASVGGVHAGAIVRLTPARARAQGGEPRP